MTSTRVLSWPPKPLASPTSSDGATTHGALDVKALLAMLAEDAAMTHSRPSSWEGSSMLQVLASHGYQLS